MITGVVEGFFGPEWSHQARLAYADFLSKSNGHFYIYAPKRDAHLRKNWRGTWGQDYQTHLSTLRDAYQSKNLEFGVALSPFGLGSKISSADWQNLKQKFKELSRLGIDRLGLFFDDMPSSDGL